MSAFTIHGPRLLVLLALGLGTLAAGVFVVFRQPTLGAVPYPETETTETTEAGETAPRSDPERLQEIVETLSVDHAQRSTEHPRALERAADYVAAELRASGVAVELQRYSVDGLDLVNLIARVGDAARDPEAPRLVVGAHYDAFGMSGPNPGADDNASGTAGLIELARLLAEAPPAGAVELVAYSTEEPPYFASPSMGSAVHARSLAEQGVPVRGMLCLEMIGFFSEHQPWPTPFYRALYPSHGQFIALVGRWPDRHLVRTTKRAMRGAAPLPTYSFTTPVRVLGLDASDHRSYWNQGWPAVLVTDTAFLRNVRYHTADDTWWTLDYQRMAQVVDGVFSAVHQLARPSD